MIDETRDGGILTEEENLFTNISTRSDVAIEIISYKHNIFERWGITFFTLIFITLIVLSYFFQYPDIVEGTAYLSSKNAPKTLLANQSGRLIRLLIKDNDLINKNDVVGWIESPEKGDHAEIDLLYNQIKSIIKQFNTSNINDYTLQSFSKNFINLGEIQNDYQELIININTLEEYHKGYYSEKRTELIEGVKSLKDINRNIQQQEKFIKESDKLANESFEMNEKLFKGGVITAEEYRQQKNKLLTNQLQLPTINSNNIINLNEQKDKLTNIKAIDYTTKQQQQIVKQNIFSLKSKIEDWLHNYCISSPINGRLYFDKKIQEFQLLKPGDAIGFTMPQSNILYAEIILPQQNIGKVDTSMEVLLQFDGYPYQEFGSVTGKLINISEIANENGFAGSIELKHGLITNQHNVIKYREGLQAKALVITKKLSMLKRFWYELIKKGSSARSNEKGK